MLLCCQEYWTSCMRPNSWKMEPMVPLLMTKTCHPGCETADVKEPLYCLFWQNASEDRGVTPPRSSRRGAHTESSFRTHNSMLWTGQLCHSLHSCCDQVRQLRTRLRSPTFTASNIRTWHSSTHAETSPRMSVLGMVETVRPLPTARRFAAGGS